MVEDAERAILTAEIVRLGTWMQRIACNRGLSYCGMSNYAMAEAALKGDQPPPETERPEL